MFSSKKETPRCLYLHLQILHYKIVNQLVSNFINLEQSQTTFIKKIFFSYLFFEQPLYKKSLHTIISGSNLKKNLIS